MGTISLKNISKSFGSTQVLKNLNVDIKDGEFLTLVGPSGCGKSTLLRIIAGLEQQTSGDVLIDDKVVNKIRASERDLAMVFQSYALYPHLTVRRNLETPLRLRDYNSFERLPLIGNFSPNKKNKTESINQLVNKTSETLKISELLDRKPGQLSGGQRQRVALGRAMVREPVAFLMDEPLSNLDAKLREEMRAFITELQKSLNITTLFVTHDQIEAIELADHIGVMFAGEMVQYGTPEEIFNHPKNPEIADFMGATNLIHGVVHSNKDNRVSVAIGNEIIQLNKSSNKEKWEEVTMTIRPEHMEFFVEGDPNLPTGNTLVGTIEEAVYHGGTVSYYIKAGDLKLQSTQRSTVTFSESSKVLIHLPPEHLWIFPD